MVIFNFFFFSNNQEGYSLLFLYMSRSTSTLTKLDILAPNSCLNPIQTNRTGPALYLSLKFLYERCMVSAQSIYTVSTNQTKTYQLYTIGHSIFSLTNQNTSSEDGIHLCTPYLDDFKTVSITLEMPWSTLYPSASSTSLNSCNSLIPARPEST